MTRVTIDLTDSEMIALGYVFAAGEAKALAEKRDALAARIMGIMAKVYDSNERAWVEMKAREAARGVTDG